MHVIDCHVHLTTQQVIEDYATDRGMTYEEMRMAMRGGPRRPGAGKHNISGSADLPSDDPGVTARTWLGLLDEAGVGMGVFMAFSPQCEYMRQVVGESNGRLAAFTSVDPTRRNATDLVERDLSRGFKGIKLYPVNRGFHVCDPAAGPVYRLAEEYDVPVLIHFGLSIDPRADLKYGNPLDLNSVAIAHPEVTFVIPHFGAGYFREVLALAYQLPNVVVDTSGMNNWTKYVPGRPSLRDVFEQTVEAMGPTRVLFGTDSAGGAAGYRKHVLEQQRELLCEIGLDEADRNLILWENAARIMRLQLPGVGVQKARDVGPWSPSVDT